MTIELTILIIITSAGLITSLISPLITGVVEFTKRIEKSSCCGSQISLSEVDKLNKTTSEHNMKLEDQQKQIVDLVNQINKI